MPTAINCSYGYLQILLKHVAHQMHYKAFALKPQKKELFHTLAKRTPSQLCWGSLSSTPSPGSGAPLDFGDTPSRQSTTERAEETPLYGKGCVSSNGLHSSDLTLLPHAAQRKQSGDGRDWGSSRERQQAGSFYCSLQGRCALTHVIHI